MGDGELYVEEIHTNDQCNIEYHLSIQTENIDYWFLVYDTNEDADGVVGAEFSISLLSNDVCNGAFPLDSASSDPIQVSTMHGLPYTSSVACVGTFKDNPGVFYKLPGNDIEIEVKACTENPSEVESQLALFSGNCSSLSCQEANSLPSACGPNSGIRWLSSSSAIYYLRVSSTVAD